jgi:hypothetical protein
LRAALDRPVMFDQPVIVERAFSDTGDIPVGSPADGTFWLTRNMFSGSYVALPAAVRAAQIDAHIRCWA